LSYFPEFLREGSALADHISPSTLVYSASDEETVEIIAALTAGVPIAAERVDARTAEAVKLLNNAWHAAKVSFANEMGLILKRWGVDSHHAFALLCSDTRLNIAPAYLTPGFAFGGSCLPKDLASTRAAAPAAGLATPHIDGLLAANRRQIDEAALLVKASGCRVVTMLGLAFKPGTDDLRNSPYVELAAALIALGYTLRIVDDDVDPARLIGANRDYVAGLLPDLDGRLCRDIDTALDSCELLIIAHRDQAEARIAAIQAHRPAILDLARSERIAALGLSYAGICW
jgi:GDP-mannose 6-dehydrogenase